MNTQISITENRITTLATAGKYCDRNIDVITDVSSDEAEVAEQKAITDSIIDRTIVEYVNSTATLVAANAFCYCTRLESVVFANATSIMTNGFGNCRLLKRAEFESLTSSLGIYATAFGGCTVLEKLVLRGQEVSRLRHANAFTGSGIASGTGYIYVPDSLVDSYKTATNWSTYANQIKPISELGE